MTALPHTRQAATAARALRTWLLWLALAVGLAHATGAWHPYAHDADHPAETAKKHAGEVCGLCLATAGIGGAGPVLHGLQLAQFGQQAPLLPRPVALRPAPGRAAHAIRAPPLFVS